MRNNASDVGTKELIKYQIRQVDETGIENRFLLFLMSVEIFEQD